MKYSASVDSDVAERHGGAFGNACRSKGRGLGPSGGRGRVGAGMIRFLNGGTMIMTTLDCGAGRATGACVAVRDRRFAEVSLLEPLARPFADQPTACWTAPCDCLAQQIKL